MGVQKFNGVLDLDLNLKCEMKTFTNDSGKECDYISYYVEVPGIGGEMQKVCIYFKEEDKKLAKYLLEHLINKAIDSKADNFFGI